MISSLSLPYVTLDHVMLADGSIVDSDVYQGRVLWNGQERVVPVHTAEGSPLIGMSMLYDQLLTVQVIDGGAVTVEPLP